MKRWLGLFAILAVAAIAVIGYLRWKASLPESRFMRIRHGMTLEEVRAIMGKEDEWRTGWDDEYDALWFDKPSKDVFSVKFDPKARVTGKAIDRRYGSHQQNYSD